MIIKIFTIVLIFNTLLPTDFIFAQENTSSDTANPLEKKDEKKVQESFNRQIYANCENKDGTIKTGNAEDGGVLQYNIDCAPFHAQEILDFRSKGRSEWSILNWINRIVTFFYRMAFVAAILGVFVAGIKYIRAGGEGGFSAAKDALKWALIGFLVSGTAWTLVAMWSRAMSMLA
ncbi:MAG: hypothetical protein H7A25_25380 [Leptospiraceae bacterium]|nr:hypothetical protein [Leptospiraceae bacterium]MCP5503255.1 hypothetical protein [Leptospiraceae bacterium]